MAVNMQMPVGMRFFFARIFPLIFVIIGALVTVFGVKDAQRSWQSTGWPTAAGVVRDSSVEFQSSSDSGSSGGTYHAKVRYEFTAGAQTHSGKRVAFGDYGSSDPSHAQGIINQYPVGKAVTVYYLAGDPDVCVLEPGMRAQALMMPGFGLLFFLIGVVMSVFLPRAMNAMKTMAAKMEQAAAAPQAKKVEPAEDVPQAEEEEPPMAEEMKDGEI